MYQNGLEVKQKGLGEEMRGEKKMNGWRKETEADEGKWEGKKDGMTGRKSEWNEKKKWRS